MPPYDSDSSDEGEEYTETNVLLGYASKEATGDSISHLGGQPSWLDESTPPSGALPKCKVCNGLLTLLVELNGDLPDHFPGHERRLYVWACRQKPCRRKDGSVRGIRGVRVAKGAGKATAKKADPPAKPKEEPKPAPTNIGSSLFGVQNGGSAPPANPFANPFSTNANGKAPVNPFSSNPTPAPKPEIKVTDNDVVENDTQDEANTTLPETFASKARIGADPAASQTPRPHEPWPAQPDFPPSFPLYHLDADYETLDAPSTPQVPSNARMELDGEGSTSGGGGKEDKDIFESSMDKTFQKFADRVGQNPEQVLRYEFRGKPLLYSDNDAIGKVLAPYAEHASTSIVKVTTAASNGGSGFPRCQNCGADRVFEVQLTPHAITELEAEDMSIDGMEWGTIILGVCSKDCKPSDVDEGMAGYVEEWAGVQWEEVASKR